MRFVGVVGLVFLLSLSAFAGRTSAETQRVRLDVNGLGCVTDMLAVRGMLEGMPGIGEFKISTETSTVDLTFDDASISVGTITKTLGEGSYFVEKVSPIDSE
jgi:copper chaperone CopZ